MVTELALVDLAEGLVEIPLRNVVRASPHAVAAADAGLRVMRNNAVIRIFPHGLGRAYRDTARVHAVHAVALDEGIAVGLAVFDLRRPVAVDLDDVQLNIQPIVDNDERATAILVYDNLKRHHLMK